jgi:hypothetical protein
MAVTVKRAVLWRRELENRPGTLAETLRPFAERKQNLQIVMGYAFPGEPDRSAVEVYPVEGEQAEQAAAAAGLFPAEQIACLLVEGDDRVGLAHEIAMKVAEAGVNIHFVVIQVVARRYNAVFGFGSQGEADQANEIITEIVRASARAHRGTGARTGGRKTTRRAATPKRGAAKKGTARKTGARKATGTRKTGARKVTGTRKATGARKTTAKKSTARKTTGARKTAGAKKAASSRGAARKSTARKTTARKSTAKSRKK